MSKLGKILPWGCCLLIAGCGQSTSVSPVIDPVAHAIKTPDSTYQVQLRYSETTSGGPCFNWHSFFSSTTYYYTNQLNLKSINGIQNATQITVITGVGEEFPVVNTNLQGTIS